MVSFFRRNISLTKVEVDNETNRLNMELQASIESKKDKLKIEEIKASIPEDRVVAKLYQIKSFGLSLPKKIDLQYAQRLPTRDRLNYLYKNVDSKLIAKAYGKLAAHLQSNTIDVFYGQFGEKYEEKTYNGFFAYNSETRNMMFFREDPNSNSYILHSYMRLTPEKAENLSTNHKLFD